MKKSRLFWLLFSMCLLIFCVPAMAEPDNGDIIGEYVSFVNPEYEEMAGGAETQSYGETEENIGASAASSAPYYSSVKKAGTSYMRDCMKNRTSSIGFQTYSLESDWESVFNEVIKQASAYSDDSNPVEGDYLRWHYFKFEGYRTRSTYGNGYKHSFTGSITYMDTASDEKKVDAKLKAVLKTLNVDKMQSEYEIVKTVYGYITSNVRYDYAMLSDVEICQKNKQPLTNKQLNIFSAYGALVNGRAVCQGYANLMYRMLRECGLSVRLIGGSSADVLHAWNIVRINGKYYHLDSTWDEGGDIYTYRYFLKGNASGEFPDHTRDPEYRTAAFNNKFPMSATSYLPVGSTAASYKIKYVLNGGTNNSKNPGSYFRTAVTLREPTRKGYTFLGWYTDSNFKNKITSIKKTAAKNYTLYAKWEKVAVGKTAITAFKSDAVGLRVYFSEVADSAGYQLAYAQDSAFDSSNTKYSYAARNARLINLDNPHMRRYYVRVRAYRLDSTGARVYGAWSKAVSGTRVRYQLNGGINGDTNPNYYYNRGTVLKNPTRQGYSFQGWYTDSAYKNKVTTLSKNAGRGMVLYARWKKTS